ncbi:CCC_1a_G0006540.mRNA.1.CDS.1 [Saccharomyces cerevisiae]|nr:CCC_1a_G0006540.mRNA.1.CDS.1 [Saccharomyces cerevisiae]CAI5240683.1 BAF_HP2_G0006130.mRNA.1.CDS.1 [Saccharomyces cerevisiae]CAI6414240.1 BAF_HP2_G0006130.mRNA.1.CDS.1 [Saccharomyces cerevisiae]CAI7175311.1 CCC_1a_G0006540.mRNA.1.CDS.1 [Saccharomyces cerevisiae]
MTVLIKLGLRILHVYKGFFRKVILKCFFFSSEHTKVNKKSSMHAFLCKIYKR